MDFLDMELSPEDQKGLSKILTEWKEKELDKMKKALEETKEAELQEIEEALISYKEELDNEYTDKLNAIVEGIKPQIKKQIITEMSDNNPDMMVLGKIKELVYPLINESGKAYVDEVATLRKELNDIKAKSALEEGESKKAKLLEGYSEKTKNILSKLIGEGTAIEITEKFYELVESFNELDGKESLNESVDDDDEDYDDEDDDIEGDEELDESEDSKETLIDEDFTPTIEKKNDEIVKTASKRVNNFKSAILGHL